MHSLMKESFTATPCLELQRDKQNCFTALHIWGKQKPSVMDIAQHSHLETEEQLLVQGHILRIVLQTKSNSCSELGTSSCCTHHNS